MDRRCFFRGAASVLAVPAVAAAAVLVARPSGRRISARENDPDFDPLAIHCRVTLDGVEVSGCYAADETLGEVRRYQKQDGRIITEFGEPMTEIVRGVVKIHGPFYA